MCHQREGEGGSGGNHGNMFENLTATLTWRAAGVAVYGGYDNVFRNLYIADQLTYSGIMFQTKYNGSQPENPITDTVLTNVSISGARRSGDAFDAKSGFGIWVNEMPEAGQGPAVGAATFTNLHLTDNAQDIKNTTTTFAITRN